MARQKKVTATVTIQFEAGQAAMAKAGQTLGVHGVNIVEVVRTYNDATAADRGEIVPAVITIYDDRSFSLATRTPPTSSLLRKAATNGGGPRVVTGEQLRAIALRKLPDLNTDDVDAAARTIAGTARSMGIDVVA